MIADLCQIKYIHWQFFKVLKIVQLRRCSEPIFEKADATFLLSDFLYSPASFQKSLGSFRLTVELHYGIYK